MSDEMLYSKNAQEIVQKTEVQVNLSARQFTVFIYLSSHKESTKKQEKKPAGMSNKVSIK